MPIRYLDEEPEEPVVRKRSIRFLDEEPVVPDTATAEPETTDQPEEPQRSYLGRLGQYWTKDIPEVLSGTAEGIKGRFSDVMKPTYLGSIAEKKLGKAEPKTFVEGLKEFPRQFAQAAADAPETAYRKIGAMAGSLGDIASVPFQLAPRALKNISGGKVDVEKPIRTFAESVSLEEPVQAAVKKYQELPEAGKANIKGTLGMLELAGLREAPKVAKVPGKVGEKLESGAGRIQGRKVKINTPEFKKGASNKLYTKYGVFGDAKSVQSQWSDKISSVAEELKTKIAANAGDPENYTSLSDIFDEAEKVLIAGKSKTDAIELSKKLRSLEPQYLEAYPDGYIDILDAHIEKRAAGKKGDWLVRNGAITANQDATANGQLYNALYDALKKNVENKGAPGIRELNKQLSEMIPMERAAAKQVLIQNRKNPISLDDYIGGLAVAGSASHGNLLPAAVMGANIISKSPTTAKGMYSLGRLMQGKKTGFSPSDITRTYLKR